MVRVRGGIKKKVKEMEEETEGLSISFVTINNGYKEETSAKNVCDRVLKNEKEIKTESLLYGLHKTFIFMLSYIYIKSESDKKKRKKNEKECPL